MEQSALMTLSSTRVSENSDLMRNASLLVLKLTSQKTSFLLVHSILMKYFRGMCKQEIFCKLSEVTHRRFHVSKWQAISLSQVPGTRHWKFTRSLPESWTSKHLSTVHRLQLLLFTLTRSNVQLQQWRVKFTYGMLKAETWLESLTHRFKEEEVTFQRSQLKMTKVPSIWNVWSIQPAVTTFSEVESQNIWWFTMWSIECCFKRSVWLRIRTYREHCRNLTQSTLKKESLHTRWL